MKDDEINQLYRIVSEETRRREVHTKEFAIANKLKQSLGHIIERIESYDAGDHEIIYWLSNETTFTCDDIINFMMLTGFNGVKAKRIIKSIYAAGITSLNNVNILAKLGYFIKK